MLRAMVLASYASAGSLSDPAGSSVLVAAVMWLQETVLGTVATSVAVVAVATVGLMMLTGQANLRHGLTVIAGCFVLFGASSIVAGIQATMAGGELSEARYDAPPVPVLPAVPPMAVNADPYAGASVPTR